MKWTDEQIKAIENKDGEMLVSASAGSGKTSVMIERLIRLITDGVDVDQVLCLTFTKAAAEGMRAKLKKELTKALFRDEFADKKDRILDQLDKLPFATITTIDAFCAKIVHKYFESSEIPTDAELLSPEEGKALRYASAVKVLEAYGESQDEEYGELVGFLGKKRSDGNVLDFLLSFYDFLSSLPDGREYIKRAKDIYEEDVLESALIQNVLMRAKASLKTMENLAMQDIKNYNTAYAKEYYGVVQDIQNALGDGVDKFSKVEKNDFPQKPKKNAKVYNGLSEDCKDLEKEMNLLAQKFAEKYDGFSIDQIRTDAKQLSPYIGKIGEITERFLDEYTAKLRKKNATDFAEIEHECLKCLRDQKTLKEVRQKYPYLLVDEFQDTNRLQDEILSLAGGEKSYFAVGDVKQSIYAFRHAEPDIFIEHREKYGVDSVVLKDNFRQDGEIIEFVNEVFKIVMTKTLSGLDYVDEAMTDGLGVPKREKSPVTIAYYPKKDKNAKNPVTEIYSVASDGGEEDEKISHEGEYIANEIEKLVGKEYIYDAKRDGDDKKRLIKYSDIVVLYRSKNDRVRRVKDVLKSKNIPIGEKIEENLPKSAEFLIHFLRVLKDRDNGESLAITLLSPAFDFTESELSEYKRQGGRKLSLYDALYSQREKEPKLQDFFAKMEKYAKRAEWEDVYGLLNYIITDTEYDKKIARGENGAWEYKLLNAYVDSLADSVVARSVVGYLNHFDSYPTFKTGYETGGENCVRFMTMHNAKGLEFPVVFCIDLSKKFNDSDKKETVLRHKRYGISTQNFYPDKMISRENYYHTALKDRITEETVVQEMRLLYVAMTRARNLLYLTGEAPSKTEKHWVEDVYSMMGFVDYALRKKPIIASLVNQELYEAESVDEDRVSEITGEERIVEKSVEFVYPYFQATQTPVKYTVTNLTKESYEDGGVSIPVQNAESKEVGTLYHRVMQNIDFSESVEKSIDKLLLDGVIEKNDLEKIDAERLKKVLTLPVFDIARRSECRREQQFLLRINHKDIKDGGVDEEVLLQGVIDLLIRNSDEYIVVDYKYSGASIDTLSHKYAVQLDLYRTAVERITGAKKVKTYIISLKTAECKEC